MRSFDWNLRGAAWAAVLTAALTGGMALAQEAGPAPATAPAAPEPAEKPEDTKLSEMWSNFLHYILLARPDLARSFGTAILQANPDPRQVYYLSVRTDRGGATLARGRGMKQLADTAEKIVLLIDQGARGVRMDAAEIARWIKMLEGTPRQMLIATERLGHSGEYAVPQMIAALEDPQTSGLLRERLTTVLPRLGRDAVRPLNEALQTRDPAVREVVARTLGEIGYAHAVPYLREVVEQKGILPRTRRAAVAAVIVCGGKRALEKPIAELFYDVAERYYAEAESLRPDSRYDTANIWYWQETGGVGLTRKEAPRAIFHEIYAMRSARKALAHDPKFYPAVPLWIASNLRKESRLPAGSADPTRLPDQPGAAYYARAAGAKYLQSVLARGLKEANLPVCTGAIAALRDTAGAENLVMRLDAQGGAQPLVTAISSPARLVRYMAAETLALARPQKRFTGWHLVVPVLTEALRQTSAKMVVLADPDLDRRNKLKDLIRAAGCRVSDASGFGEALEAARATGGVDLCVLTSGITAPDFRNAVGMLRVEAVFSRLPVVVVARPAEVIAARALGRSDDLIRVVPEAKADAAGMPEAIKWAIDVTAGPTALSPDEAAQWAIRAANALRLLAETKNPVYDLDGATKSLIAALDDQRDPVRIASARALATFRSAQAQRAIAALADNDQASEEVRLAAYAALAESMRLFDNQLTEEEVRAVVDVVVSKGSLKIREGAAQVLGVMNLPSEKIKELILSTE